MEYKKYMELKEIAAISGKPGLYKILKSTPKGVIVETLDAQKKRLSIGINHRVSILKEISIYTTTEEGTESLEQALHNIHQRYNGELPVHKKSEEKELRVFMQEIVPDYDEDRVFHADMKKLVSWYSILFEFIPEIFDNLLKEENQEATSDEAEENTPAEETVNAEETSEEVAQKETDEEEVAETTPAEETSNEAPKEQKTSSKKTAKE